MKRLALLVFAIVMPLCGRVTAQSSDDAWDSAFHPQAAAQRKEQRYQQWLQSWKGRECTAADVKAFWLMTLTQSVPDPLAWNYYQVQGANANLKDALDSGACDFDAQDVADRVNILQLRLAGKKADADALERLRLERVRLRQEQQMYQNILAAQQNLQAEIDRLKSAVSAAEDNAALARIEANQ